MNIVSECEHNIILCQLSLSLVPILVLRNFTTISRNIYFLKKRLVHDATKKTKKLNETFEPPNQTKKTKLLLTLLE